MNTKQCFISAIVSMASVISIFAQNSPYIHKVYEYNPAPGQFVNVVPEYEDGDTAADMLSKAEEQLVGAASYGMVSLGAFGGYIVFGFDHPVVNIENQYDFKINGNALRSDSYGSGGSSEPGIVMVSVDVNGNGLPDDEWYELAGSEYDTPSTIKNYHITYYCPDEAHIAVPDPNDRNVTDKEYIRWTAVSSLDENSGFIEMNISHRQSYWPLWIDTSTLEFSGTKLANNYIDVNGDGSYFALKILDWGYVDNLPASDDPGFKIDWAVDSEGNPVKLHKIDFLRVHTGVNQTCGRLGETSTEICGAVDLHPDAIIDSGNISVIDAASVTDVILLASDSFNLSLRNGGNYSPILIYSSDGSVALSATLKPGDSIIDISALPSGIYMLRCESNVIKFAK